LRHPRRPLLVQEYEAIDIVVSIFWTRIGTELLADFPGMRNDKPYPSALPCELLTAPEALSIKRASLSSL
jgi:hypothetical protein